MTISPQQLRSLLQQQFDSAGNLLQILAQENATLSGNDLQGLETILAAKQTCISQLEASSREYLESARQQSGSLKDGMATLLLQSDPEGKLDLVPLWRKIEKILHQCRHNNSVNGKIIALGYQRTQRALAILRHGELGSEPCYSPSGNRPSSGSSRTLGKV